MVPLLIGSLLMLPITIYSITRKSNIPISPDFQKMEKEINDWLKGRTYEIYEKYSAETDSILIIDPKAIPNTASSEQVPYFTRMTIDVGDDY